MLEQMLGEPLNQATLDAIPIIFDLMYEYEYYWGYYMEGPYYMQEASMDQIRFVLSRILTPEEEAALQLFQEIQSTVMYQQFLQYYVPELEDMLGRTLGELEIPKVWEFFQVFAVYSNIQDEFDPDLHNPDFHLIELEAMLGYELTQAQKEGILFVRVLFMDAMLQDQLGEAYTQAIADALPIVFDLMEDYAYAWVNTTPWDLFEATNEEIESLLGPLTEDQLAALAIARSMQGGGSGSLQDFISMLETQFETTFSLDDYDDLEVFYNVILEYQSAGGNMEGFFNYHLFELEVILEREFDSAEYNSMIYVKALISIAQMEKESVEPLPQDFVDSIPIVVLLDELYAENYDPLSGAPEMFYAANDTQIVDILGRSLTTEEQAALTTFRYYMMG